MAVGVDHILFDYCPADFEEEFLDLVAKDSIQKIYIIYLPLVL